MSSQGLTESVGVLESCFGVERKDARGDKEAKSKGKHDQRQANNNDNSNVMQAASDDTIYKNAMDKRTSSSSEEGGALDSSDEIILDANIFSGTPPRTDSD